MNSSDGPEVTLHCFIIFCRTYCGSGRLRHSAGTMFHLSLSFWKRSDGGRRYSSATFLDFFFFSFCTEPLFVQPAIIHNEEKVSMRKSFYPFFLPRLRPGLLIRFGFDPPAFCYVHLKLIRSFRVRNVVISAITKPVDIQQRVTMVRLCTSTLSRQTATRQLPVW